MKIELVSKMLKKSDRGFYRTSRGEMFTKDGYRLFCGTVKSYPMEDGCLIVYNGYPYKTVLLKDGYGVLIRFEILHYTESLDDIIDEITRDDRFYFTCEECGARELITKKYNVDIGDICEECYSEHYTECEECGEVIRIDDAYWDDDRECYVCEDCWERYYITCYECGEKHYQDNMTEIHGGDYVCDDCLSSYRRCDDCGEYYPEEDLHYCDSDECYYCDDCIDNHPNDIIGYHDYQGEYTLRQLKDDRSRHFGIELETENNTYTASKVNEFGWLHCEHDGSLNDGYEIISQPLSLNLWYKWGDFKGLTEYLIKEGVRSHDTSTCGLHIHASRDEINNVDRVVAICEMFRGPLEVLARRANNSYATFMSSLLDYSDVKDLKKGIKDKCYNGSRYQAVNTTNWKTIEFRFFRGTLNYNKIMASIELVNNIIEVANSTQTIIRFNDLLKGKYLPKYAKQRKVNTDIKIDISEFINTQVIKGGDLNVCYSL